MKRLALVAIVAACGAQPQPASGPATIRRPVEDKAAIAPPPPVPEVPMPGGEPSTAEPDDSTRPLEDAVHPVTSFDIVEPTGAPANAKLAGSVLVWADASFYVAPKDGAVSLQLAKLPTRKDHVGEAMPMRVVSTAGAFVEVDMPLTDSFGNHVTDCVWFGLKTQHDVGPWRLFVKRADLAPVVAKKFSTTFDDGSRITVEPGLPILALVGGASLVGFSHVWVPAALPASAIGYAYPTPPPPKEPSPFSGERSRREQAEYKHLLRARTVGIANTQQPLRGVFAPLAKAVETKGSRVAFPIEDTCGALTVLASPTDVKPYKSRRESALSGLGGIGHGEVMGVEKWTIPRGTRLVAQNGKASTTATLDISVPKPVAGAKQVCIERNPYVSTPHVFGPKTDDIDGVTVKLCVPTRLLKHTKAPKGFGSGSGSGLRRRRGRSSAVPRLVAPPSGVKPLGPVHGN